VTKLFVYLDILGPLLALPFFFYKGWNHSRSTIIIMCFLVLQLLANSWAKAFMLMTPPKTNVFIYQANSFLSCVIVGFYFMEQFKCRFSARSFLWARIYIVASCTVLLSIIFFEGGSFFNRLSYAFCSFTVCVLSVAYYLQSLLHVKDENPVDTSSFWAVTAFFIYYSTNFFIFLYYGTLSKAASINPSALWGIHNSLLFLACLLLIKASKHR
jgi:hypothetical protein